MALYLHLLIKLSVGFAALFVATKSIGGREVKQLTVFDFISAIVMSELVGNVLFQEEATALHMVFAVAVWTLLIIGVDTVTMRSRAARRLFDGEPELIIEKGRIDKTVLKKHHLDLNELMSLLRQKEIFAVRDVAYAFLEPNGSLTLVRDGASGEAEEARSLSMPLIVDGHASHGALMRLGKDMAWLERQLRDRGFERVRDVFYAECRKEGPLHIQSQPDIPRRADAEDP